MSRTIDMRISDDYWVYIQSSKSGKWIIRGTKEEIEEIAKRLEPLIESGDIEAAKYTKKDPAHDPYPDIKTYALCVYCREKERARVKVALCGLGANAGAMEWKYNIQTLEEMQKRVAICLASAPRLAARHGRPPRLRSPSR